MYDNPSTTSINYTTQIGTPNEKAETYQLDAVDLEIFPGFEVLNNVSFVHPLGDEA